MSQHSSDDTSWIPIAIVVAVAIASYIVWQLSTMVGLDMSTGASVFGRLIFLAILAGFMWKFGDDYPVINLSNSWPVLLGLLWACWWPALNYWATKDYPSFYHGDDLSVWWSAWYTKFGGLLLLVGAGYGVNIAVRRE